MNAALIMYSMLSGLRNSFRYESERLTSEAKQCNCICQVCKERKRKERGLEERSRESTLRLELILIQHKLGIK